MKRWFSTHTNSLMFAFVVLVFVCGCFNLLFILGLQNETLNIPIQKQTPLFIIGGFPRSGTTLLRVMLDAHPDIRCGQETRIIPKMLKIREEMEFFPFEMDRIKAAGVTTDVLDTAFQKFIFHIISTHGPPAKNLCDKDPFNLKYMIYLIHLFKNCRFILMIRDGRAVVHSLMKRQVPVGDLNIRDAKDCLIKWNKQMSEMYALCIRVGSKYCMPVYYEHLVLKPELWLKRVLDFLNIPWHPAVLHHQDYIEQPNGVKLSTYEESTDQVIKPIYTDSLTNWTDRFMSIDSQKMDILAPILKKLGYDIQSISPNYTMMKTEVLENTLHLRDNRHFYRNRIKNIFDKPPFNVSLPTVKYF